MHLMKILHDMTENNAIVDVLDETIVNALLLALRPLPPPRAQALRTRVLAHAASELPTTRHFVTIHGDQGDWIALAPGVEVKLLHKDARSDSQSYLLRLAPHAELPAHRHAQDEECMVLEGEVTLGDVVAKAGAYHLAPKGLAHGVIRSDTGALLFLRGALHLPQRDTGAVDERSI